MAQPGRRPGNAGTRGAIIEAARAAFTEQGYTDTTIRAVARRAEVDPALVYHYFGDKAGLFIDSLQLPADPRQVKLEASEGGWSGERVVERFLAQWEGDPDRPGHAFITMAQAMASSPGLARGMREFLRERVWSYLPPSTAATFPSWRASLVSSQLVGLGWARYILGVEPLASASREEVARRVGPTIERYVEEAP
jgi:AcrR family transcriptional regulator